MPEMIKSRFPWLFEKIFDNSTLDYILAGLTFVVVWFALCQLKAFVAKYGAKLEQSKRTNVLGFILRLVGSTSQLMLIVLAVYIATSRLEMAPLLEKWLSRVTAFVIIFQITLHLSRVIDHFVQRYSFGHADEDLSLKSARANLSAILRIAIWIAGILFLLSNFGINITTFITGLGIGGIAIALAAQAILGDVFSSFTIAIDKPFEVGDFIIVDSLKGTIEQIGLKTTRIRSLDGELLVIANSDLTKSRIQNFKRMSSRRVNFKIGVTYGTKIESLKEIPGLIKKAIEASQKVRFERAHFMEFGDSALVFDVVYHVNSPDYIEYAKVQESVNLQLYQDFEDRNIQFAFPTQTLHVETFPEGTLQGQKPLENKA